MAVGSVNFFMNGENSDRHHEEEGWPGPWHMMGTGGFWMFPIFPIIILIVIFYFLFGKNNGHWSGSGRGDSPLDILKKRYAKGEITKEEYEEIKKEL